MTQENERTIAARRAIPSAKTCTHEIIARNGSDGAIARKPRTRKSVL